jgi:hypothetical protein
MPYSTDVAQYLTSKLKKTRGKQLSDTNIEILLRLHVSGTEIDSDLLIDSIRFAYDHTLHCSFNQSHALLHQTITKLNQELPHRNFILPRGEYSSNMTFKNLGITPRHEDRYLTFLGSRVSLYYGSSLVEYFCYIKQNHPELVKPFRESFTAYADKLTRSRHIYNRLYDLQYSDKELVFFKLIFYDDFNNPNFIKALNNIHLFYFFTLLAHCWDEIPQNIKEIVMLDAPKQIASSCNHMKYNIDRFMDIVCLDDFKDEKLLVEMFQYVRSSVDGKRFLKEGFKQSQMCLYYRVLMAAHFLFIRDFQSEIDLYGKAFILELCFK